MTALSAVRRMAGTVAGPILVAAAWAYTVSTLLTDHGLFVWIAFDFGIFWAAARLFVLHGAAAAYDLTSMPEQIRLLTAFYGPEASGLHYGPFPYPAVLLLLLGPLALLPPVVAYLVWTGANAALAAYVVWGLAARCGRRRWHVAAAALGFYPLVDCLLQGQVVVLLLVALYRAYVALERGQEGRAGLWAGLLLLKPQYAVGLALVLLLKGRWRALAGFAATGAVLAGASLALLGPTGLPVYLATFNEYGGFRALDTAVRADLMINWRALLVRALPVDFPESAGSALTGVFGLATLAVLPLVWHGRWRPEAPSFAPRMLVTVIATLLASPHSHAHGATLLLVPGLALAAQGLPAGRLRVAVHYGVYLPPVLFALAYPDYTYLTNLVLLLLLVVAFVELVRLEAPGWGAIRALRPYGRPRLLVRSG